MSSMWYGDRGDDLMLESLQSIGSILLMIGAVSVYLIAWAIACKLIIDAINHHEYVLAALLAALLVVYTGAGILFIGRVI